ncbi:hypothetical protein M1L60_46560 [Actinoplanes sp. TRM 88003]|uniref:Uncharacterized protein n=1 Tax=Paractinoplanes aksuensis TaxID=2939490 RepID=A0ABT1E4J3_9ACTN|nr:hypothetical protein [Actinoplanes aksuensis]MCO8278057.1 hypothetical protein [Actinoplanes aksuensis]
MRPKRRSAGLDCSIGHQLSRFGAFETCLREAMGSCAVIRARYRTTVPALNLGGGHAVAYADGDDGFAVAARLPGAPPRKAAEPPGHAERGCGARNT